MQKNEAAGIIPGGPSKRKEKEEAVAFYAPRARNSAGSMGSSWQVTLKCT